MISTMKEALLYLVEKQQGNLAEAQSYVESELLDKFRILGYIRCGQNKWQITSAGVRQSLFYREPTAEEREQGKLMHQLDIR